MIRTALSENTHANLMAHLQVSVVVHVFIFLSFLLPTSYFSITVLFTYFFPLHLKPYSELIPHGRVNVEVDQPDILDITLYGGQLFTIQ